MDPFASLTQASRLLPPLVMSVIPADAIVGHHEVPASTNRIE